MTRKAFIAVLFSPLSILARSRKPRREYLADFKTLDWSVKYPSAPKEKAIQRDCLALRAAKCFVDGREIHSVWYVDTREGIVKSYDIDQNGGKPQVSFTGRKCAPQANPRLTSWELLADQLPVEDAGGVLSVTLRGRIELFGEDGTRFYG